MKRAIAAILAISTFAAAAFTGCAKNDSSGASQSASSSAASQQVNLTFSWWGTQTRHDATLKVIKMYEKANPNVKVTPVYQGFDGYYKKLAMLAAANNLPDIFQFYVGTGDSQQFIDKKQLAPLDSYISQKVIDTSKISANVLSTGKYNGVTYGIPLGINAKTMVVDPTIYSKAGLTVPASGYASWSDVEKDLVKLKKATGAYGGDDLLGENAVFPYYCRQNGEIQYDSKKLIGFSEKTYVDFYTMKKGWQEKGLIPPVDVVSSIKDPSGSELAQHKAGINTIYSSEFDNIQKASGDALQLIPLPGPNAMKAEDVRFSHDLAISSQSSNVKKTEAAKFISYFINDIDANKVIKGERGIPVNSTVLDALKPSFSENKKTEANFMEKIQKLSSPMDPPAPTQSTQIDTLMVDLEQQILYGKITPAEGYKQIQSKVQELLANQ